MVSKCDIENRIYAYRFAMYDLGLYLDTHPHDKKALHLRGVYQAKLTALIEEYEQCYGKFVLTKCDAQDNWNAWVSDPWPWDGMKGAGRCVAI